MHIQIRCKLFRVLFILHIFVFTYIEFLFLFIQNYSNICIFHSFLYFYNTSNSSGIFLKIFYSLQILLLIIFKLFTLSNSSIYYLLYNILDYIFILFIFYYLLYYIIIYYLYYSLYILCYYILYIFYSLRALERISY